VLIKKPNFNALQRKVLGLFQAKCDFDTGVLYKHNPPNEIPEIVHFGFISYSQYTQSTSKEWFRRIACSESNLELEESIKMASSVLIQIKINICTIKYKFLNKIGFYMR
jgi:hypothetical protein